MTPLQNAPVAIQHAPTAMQLADRAEILRATTADMLAIEKAHISNSLRTVGNAFNSSGRAQPAAIAIMEEVVFQREDRPEVLALCTLFGAVEAQWSDAAIAEAARRLVRLGILVTAAGNMQDRKDGVAPRLAFVPGTRS
jgi:hypothetical protein